MKRANTDHLTIRTEFRKNWNGETCTKGYIMYKRLEIGYTWFNPHNGVHYVNWYNAQGGVEAIRAASTYSEMLDVVELMGDTIYNNIVAAQAAQPEIVSVKEQRRAEFGRYIAECETIREFMESLGDNDEDK